ncbi:zeta toxin family protein [Pseudomonas nicosulfuronedens]
MLVPRLRVFAGPNGSGKSTIKRILDPQLLYIYINADDLELEASGGSIDLSPFSIAPTQRSFIDFFSAHPLIVRADLLDDARYFRFVGNTLVLDAGMDFNSYHASVLADYIRHQLLETRASFTFETVMSDRSKVEFIQRAKALGYRTYLYFVATESPEININRVEIRVAEGGHNVDSEKIRARYDRCLELLPEAVMATSRAYLFDNSGAQAELEVEITDASTFEYKIEEVHEWCIDAVEALGRLVDQN